MIRINGAAFHEWNREQMESLQEHYRLRAARKGAAAMRQKYSSIFKKGGWELLELKRYLLSPGVEPESSWGERIIQEVWQ